MSQLRILRQINVQAAAADQDQGPGTRGTRGTGGGGEAGINRGGHCPEHGDTGHNTLARQYTPV